MKQIIGKKFKYRNKKEAFKVVKENSTLESYFDIKYENGEKSIKELNALKRDINNGELCEI